MQSVFSHLVTAMQNILDKSIQQIREQLNDETSDDTILQLHTGLEVSTPDFRYLQKQNLSRF